VKKVLIDCVVSNKDTVLELGATRVDSTTGASKKVPQRKKQVQPTMNKSSSAANEDKENRPSTDIKNRCAVENTTTATCGIKKQQDMENRPKSFEPNSLEANSTETIKLLKAEKAEAVSQLEASNLQLLNLVNEKQKGIESLKAKLAEAVSHHNAANLQLLNLGEEKQKEIESLEAKVEEAVGGS
jgi:hypothetical protein